MRRVRSRISNPASITPPPAARAFRIITAALVATLALAGCGAGSSEEEAATTEVAGPAHPVTLIAGERAEELAAGAAKLFFAQSSLVVLAAPGLELQGASAAAALGVPVLIDGPNVAETIAALGAEVVLAVGDVSDPGVDVVVAQNDEHLARLVGAQTPQGVDGAHASAELAALAPGAGRLLVPADGQRSEGESATANASTSSEGGAAPTFASEREELPKLHSGQPLENVIVLSAPDRAQLAAMGTARAAGARILEVPGADPGTQSKVIQALSEAPDAAVVGLGNGFGTPEVLQWRVSSAQTGVELPGGGQRIFPGKTYVALYGNPVTDALGVLGEQGPEETIERARSHAEELAPLTDNTVVPALEIIATVASGSPGDDESYSTKWSVESLRPLVDLAKANGQYVGLDLQPGRQDFLTQAKMYEELLREPHVGLALDPEWRLKPDQVHLRQIGSVDIDEVNQVVTWLADFTRENNLPQKLLVLHQFQTRMIPGVNSVDQSRAELAILVHVDGQGSQPAKQGTWRALHDYAPAIEHWGWKNFYDEDSPMLNAEQTMAQVAPTPDLITYQ